MFSESLGDKERENKRCIAVNLDRLGGISQFTPRDSLVRSRTCVRAVELLTRIHIHSVFGAVSHEVGVQSVVFHNASTKHHHGRSVRVDGQQVEFPHIRHYVHA